MAGFGGRQGHGYGFGIAHLADEDDVGVLPHHRAQAMGERIHVSPDFTLGNQGIFLGIDVFHRVFECDDSAGPCFIDAFDQGGDGGAFAGSGDAGKQDQAVFAADDVLPDVIGKADFFRRRDFRTQRPNRGAQAVIFIKGVDAELKRSVTVRTIHRGIPFEGFDIFFAQQGINQLFGDILGYDAAL